MTRVLVLLLAASCLCSASSSRARTSGGDEAAFVPVWLDVVSNIVNAARYTDAAAKSTDQDLAMLPSLEALKTSAGTNACMNCTKAQMLENQITILSAVQSAFETVRQRCVDEPQKYSTRLVRWAASNAGPPLNEEEQRAVTSAAAAMAKKIRHLFDTAVCPTLVRDTETSLSKLEGQTREADKDAGRPAGWSQRWAENQGTKNAYDDARLVKKFKYDKGALSMVDARRGAARVLLRDLAQLCPHQYGNVLAKERHLRKTKAAVPTWTALCEAHGIGPADWKNLLRPGGALDDIRSLASKLTSKPAVAFLFDVSAAVAGMTALSGGLSGGLSVASNTAFLVSRFLDGSTTDADCKRAAAIMMGVQGGAEGGGEEGAKKGGAKTASGHQHPPFQRV